MFLKNSGTGNLELRQFCQFRFARSRTNCQNSKKRAWWRARVKHVTPKQMLYQILARIFVDLIFIPQTPVVSFSWLHVYLLVASPPLRFSCLNIVLCRVEHFQEKSTFISWLTRPNGVFMCGIRRCVSISTVKIQCSYESPKKWTSRFRFLVPTCMASVIQLAND